MSKNASINIEFKFQHDFKTELRQKFAKLSWIFSRVSAWSLDGTFVLQKCPNYKMCSSQIDSTPTYISNAWAKLAQIFAGSPFRHSFQDHRGDFWISSLKLRYLTKTRAFLDVFFSLLGLKLACLAPISQLLGKNSKIVSVPQALPWWVSRQKISLFDAGV